MYKIFTVEGSHVVEGAEVQDFTFRSGEITIQAITVGEDGRGRKLGVLSVSGAKAGDTLIAASVSATRSGKPKLLAANAAKSDEKAIIVFRTKIGYRGGNRHTGDANGWICPACDGAGEGAPPDDCTHCDTWSSRGPQRNFVEFPGEILAEGAIAQGAAGRAGSGKQIIAIVPKGTVFRTSYSGRLYGGASEHFYQFDGEKIIALTAEEREMADLF